MKHRSQSKNKITNVIKQGIVCKIQDPFSNLSSVIASQLVLFSGFINCVSKCTLAKKHFLLPAFIERANKFPDSTFPIIMMFWARIGVFELMWEDQLHLSWGKFEPL